MLSKKIGTKVMTAAVSVAALIGSVGSAQAKSYPGAWDPVYGAPFAANGGLGWKGTGDFFIPDACEASPAGWILNSDGCSGGGMTVTNVQLSFYNVASSVVVQTFALAPAAVYQMYWDAGITGVDSGFYAAATPSTAGALAIAGNGVYSFHMRFEFVAVPSNTPSVQLYHTVGSQNPVCLILQNCDGDFGGSETLATLIVTPQVPEPGTYALMIAGLGAVGFMARRRAR